jgi:GntR family transcriptional regulator
LELWHSDDGTDAVRDRSGTSPTGLDAEPGGAAEPLIRFRLDRRSGIAPYRQLTEQIRQAVRHGIARPGDRLPSVREVVAQISINPNTVHRAYRELEIEGVVEGRQGLGTFVSDSVTQVPALEWRAELRAELGAWLAKARSVGIDREGITALIAEALEDDEDPAHTGEIG